MRKQKCAHKKELFSRVILNLLAEWETIRTSGKEVRELFDTVYADVVQGKKSDEAISVETTFSELCSNPDKSLGAEPVDSTVMEKLTEAKRNLPEQKTQELQKKVDAAVDNIIRNFSAVRMSTGIVYRSSKGRDSRGDRRIFSDIKLSEFIAEAKNRPAMTKEVELERMIQRIGKI